MAHKRDYKPEDILFPNQVITESELVDEMHRSQRKVDRMDYLIHTQEKRMK